MGDLHPKIDCPLKEELGQGIIVASVPEESVRRTEHESACKKRDVAFSCADRFPAVTPRQDRDFRIVRPDGNDRDFPSESWTIRVWRKKPA